MNVICPTCSHSLEREPNMSGVALECPACGALVPASPVPTTLRVERRARRSPLHAVRGLNRNVQILGALALLLLGGVATFLAWDQVGNIFNKRERVHRRTINNEFFTTLVTSGAATKSALLETQSILPYSNGFIGLSKEKLTLKEAQDLAARTGSEILDVAVTAYKSRKEFTTWLTDSYPAQQGTTVWVRDNLQTRVIDSPDVLEVALGATVSDEAETIDSSAIRREVFLRWPKLESWENEGWSWTVEPQFDEVTPFSRWGMARVRVGEAWGLIDEAGTALLPPTFDIIEPFEEQGSARASKDGKWGLIDKTGKLVAQPEWEDVQHFINGFIPVKRAGKWGYLDAAGKLAIACDWEDAWRFSPEGFAIVTRDGKRGFIDHTGKVIVEPVWDGAVNFCKEGIGLVRSGPAAVKDTGAYLPGWALIDTTGRLLSFPKYEIAWDRKRRFDLGLLAVRDRTDAQTAALLDLYGNEVPDSRSNFSIMQDDLFYCSRPENTSLIAANGIKVATVAGEVRGESGGLSKVLLRDSDTFGLADRSGQWVVRPQFKSIGMFVNEAAPFQGMDGKWGRIDRKGTVLIKPEWDEIGRFQDGVTFVKRANKWGLVGADGVVISEPVWTMVGDFADGLAAVTADTAYITPGRRSMQSAKTLFIDKGGNPAFEGKSWPTMWHGVGSEAPRFRNGLLVLEELDRSRRISRNKQLNLKGEESDAPAGTQGILGLRAVHPFDYGGYGKHPFGYTGTDFYGFSRANTILDASGASVMSAVGSRPEILADFIPHSTPAKYGLIDASGKVLVEPIWDEAHILSPDWVWFRSGAKCGLADRAGKVWISPAWDELTVLPVESATLDKDGKTILLGMRGQRFLAPWVRVKDGTTTKILQINGQPAIPANLPDAEYVDFYGPGHVAIRQPDGQGGFVLSLVESATGKQTRFPEALALRWNWQQSSHGLLWMRDRASSRWRLMHSDARDTQHSQPLEEKPDGWGFVEGRAALHQPDGWIIVDTELKQITPEKWEATHDFFEGRAAVQREGRWGFLALDGQQAIPQIWEDVRDFQHGLAAVKKDGRWGYINPEGKVVIDPVWDGATDFRQWYGEPRNDGALVALQVATVTIRGEAALIDRTGALIVDPSKERVNFNGSAVHNGTDAWIVVDTDGEPALAKRTWTEDTIEVSARRGWKPNDVSARKDAMWSLVDDTGRALTDPAWLKSWRKKDPLSGGLILARDARQKSGLLRRDGTVAIPPQFEKITWIAPGIAAVWTATDGGLIDAKGTWVFRDNDQRRIARFSYRYREDSPQLQHGLAIIEDVPKWGYARLNR